MMNMNTATCFAAIVGAVVRDLRQRRGYDQEDMADALGIAQASLSRLENGRSAFSLEHLKLVGRELGASPSAILETAEGWQKELTRRGVVVTTGRRAGNNLFYLNAAAIRAAAVAAE